MDKGGDKKNNERKTEKGKTKDEANAGKQSSVEGMERIDFSITLG